MSICRDHGRLFFFVSSWPMMLVIILMSLKAVRASSVVTYRDERP
jgi:hypothetical protein